MSSDDAECDSLRAVLNAIEVSSLPRHYRRALRAEIAAHVHERVAELQDTCRGEQAVAEAVRALGDTEMLIQSALQTCRAPVHRAPVALLCLLPFIVYVVPAVVLVPSFVHLVVGWQDFPGLSVWLPLAISINAIIGAACVLMALLHLRGRYVGVQRHVLVGGALVIAACLSLHSVATVSPAGAGTLRIMLVPDGWRASWLAP
ncbi:MAG: hypothetical protein H6993_00430 [Pseudomonadales bacterium]|nr:hypothetical protein [Pseudomonadales bacterium]MCP5182389.1 hypothetical protein [Pseudomonadales bacterium]